MARYIDAELLMQKLSRMIDYCEKNKDKKFNALNVLFQVGDAIMDCPSADVVPKSEVEEAVEKLMSATDKVICEAKADVAREIFEEIEKALYHLETPVGKYLVINSSRLAELKKKYAESENG